MLFCFAYYFLQTVVKTNRNRNHLNNNNFACLIFTVDKTPPGFPLITQSPQTRVIEIGHTAVMQCKSTGNPNPKIHWLKDGKRLEMNQRYTLIDGKL